MARTTPLRLLSAVADSGWMIAPEWRDAIRSAVALVAAETVESAEELREKLRAQFAPLARPSAVAADLGEPLEGARRATARDGVAIVSVMGPLWHYANFMTEICGDTAYEDIAADLKAIRAAHAAGIVGACLLEVDSPGGMVAGCADTAHMIRELSGEMPVTSFIAGQGCSAGYYVAASAPRVVVARGSLTGSVGTVATFRIRKGGAGVEVQEIVSSQSPKKRVDLSTPEGVAQVQTWVDDLAEEFIEDMAAFRGRTVEQVLADFGQGDVMVAKKAVAAGLADAIGTFEGELAMLAELAKAASRGAPAFAGGSTTLTQEDIVSTEEKKPAPAEKPQALAPEHVTADWLTANRPEVVQALRADGATAERTRILSIQSLQKPGDEEAVAACIADASCTKADAALRIMEAREKAGRAEAGAKADYLAGMKGDEEKLEKPAPAAEAEPNSEAAQIAAILNAGKPATIPAK